MYNVGFERDLFSQVAPEQIAELAFANELYAAMCNMRWVKKDCPKERRNEQFWSCTWRTAGAIVAELRNELLDRDSSHSAHENYLDFYCAGKEGEVSDRIRVFLDGLGWQPFPWDESGNIDGD